MTDPPGRVRLRVPARLPTAGLLVVVAVAFVPLLEQLPVVGHYQETASGITASLALGTGRSGRAGHTEPRPREDEPMLWQAVDKMSFRLVGGYALVPGANGLGRYYLAPDANLALLSSAVTASDGPPVTRARLCRALDAVLRARRVDALILRTADGPVHVRGVAILESLLGPPAASFPAGTVWYHLRARPAPACPTGP